jgi:hypothetical protein
MGPGGLLLSFGGYSVVGGSLGFSRVMRIPRAAALGLTKSHMHRFDIEVVAPPFRKKISMSLEMKTSHKKLYIEDGSDPQTPSRWNSDVLGHPASYGLENVEAGCCGTTGLFEMGYTCNAWSPLTCADAGKFAFWDAIHPTERLHRALADAKMNTTLHVFL